MDNKINIELYLIRFLWKYINYNKFFSFIELKFLQDNSTELHRILTAVDAWHKRFPERDISSVEEFSVFFYTLFPPVSEKGTEITDSLFLRLSRIEVEDAIAQEFLTAHIHRARAAKTSLLALEVSEGRKPFDALVSDLEGLETLSTPDQQGNEFVVMSEEEGFPASGLRWRLNCLNRALGSLRRGDNGFVFARPEAGKTTFALDQSTFMAEQAESCVLYANNEQPGELMYQRAVQASLGITAEQFFKYKKQALKKFKEKTPNGFHIYDKAYITSREVDHLCRKYGPSLLVFDQLDKVKGFDSKTNRDDVSLKHLYQWARELSKEYCPVIGLCQAGGTAEGKKWLTMDDVDSSKTSKQGEADWILGIGQSHQPGMESIRHFNISKNKLLGDHDTDPKMRHGKMDTRIQPEICRFIDV